eukprot:1564063-Alexandrium_andersonii.AAC.1
MGVWAWAGHQSLHHHVVSHGHAHPRPRAPPGGLHHHVGSHLRVHLPSRAPSGGRRRRVGLLLLDHSPRLPGGTLRQ